ncbi:DUF5683 domain-containing protein [Salegentibacter echinorum]|uniref:DUF5683 domain-containing protein n=1 Tax=Salegentibacter echinorum TaxID=1073325 RepID=UPI00093369E2|nr:DUF5683 domain-containing protein [Salegentibacter echinorum]
MKNSRLLLTFFLLFFAWTISAQQQDSLMVEEPVARDTISKDKDYKPYNALAPAKAAFYSAVLPGLGQAYNGRYWKIPIVYGGLGVGIYFYIKNDDQWNRYRDAYKARLAGREDEFLGRLSTDALIRAQEVYRKNKEISILVTAGIYVLNIIDANVDAHLQQFNVSEDLTLKPNMRMDNYTGKSQYGLSLNYKF